MTKTCSTCKATKNIGDFGPRKKNTDGHNGSCRRCMTDRVLERRRANIDQFNARSREIATVPKSRFSRFKKRCLNTDKDFQLTFDQWSTLVLGNPCHYCDGQLETKGCALDRKDNSIGYICHNVVPCCKECNRLKGPTLTYIEMLAVSATLKSMRAKS